MPEKPTLELRWFTRQRDILSVRKAGKHCRGKYVFCWSLQIAPGDTAVAVVTGRGFKTAVSRNLAKRRLRGALLDSREAIEPGRMYLFEARPGTDRADYQLLVIEVETALSRVRN